MLGEDAIELAPLYDQLSIMLFLHEREDQALHAAKRAMEILQVRPVLLMSLLGGLCSCMHGEGCQTAGQLHPTPHILPHAPPGHSPS